MEKARIAVALVLAGVATAVMVNMQEYVANIFRNTLSGWFGPPGQTVGMAVAAVYAVAVFAFMFLVSYTVIHIFETGLKE